MRRIAAAVLLALSATALAKPHVLAVFGDMPYGRSASDTTAFEATPAFIDAINADPAVELAFHLGDLHSGRQPCTEAYDRAVLALFQRLRMPFIYTPGDNEWMDCHKPGEGGGTWDAERQRPDYVRGADGALLDFAGGDPLENLTLVRQLFFPQAGHTLARDLRVTSQAHEHALGHPDDGDYVENIRLVRDGVLYVTVNIPGGSNNGQDPWFGAPAMSRRQAGEVERRTGATVRWLQAAFATARTQGLQAVVVATQADLWDLDGREADHTAGYEPYVEAIAAGATSFARPVLLLVGDSHHYRSDNPFVAGSPCQFEGEGAATVPCADDAAAVHPGYAVRNIHRVVVHGSALPHEWLRLTVDLTQNAPASALAFGPFRWTRQLPSR